VSPAHVPQILVAGIGNAWLRDDGFGGEVAKRMQAMELPDGVSVADFGTGGLDLAYEVMRGYDALILIDATQQDTGEPPGTLYVMETEEGDVDGSIADGDMIDPHSMDPGSVLRFVRYVGGWPGRVAVIGVEPENVEEPGYGLSDSVTAAIEPAIALVLETAHELGIPVQAAAEG
jgi:hydrogenase maturation protease